ncbi:BTAD domain-containing putative transcriptional regulator [Asanoa sp. WMMD1127]|uniref:AfsR/SARP family transcriptional regulator n=1 Tax=Asanoa sp. WMMD1127 TaxID=3016107 RepID=UPI002415D7D2|nr:AfsR/SARP family transcriptional regulator [Asanoa sp. WMMD1127]MDG4825008.1 BTAD domain-containing putative transcriptional regulator [Asanoa sp. WMMD1127]
MNLRVLGDMQALVGGRALELGPAKQRLVFAVLAVDAGRNVSIEALLDRVWDDARPADARGALYTYLTRIRRILTDAQPGAAAPITVVRGRAGYRLDTNPDNVDLHRLRRLAERALALPPGDAGRSALLREAIDLWRGEPLDGLPGGWAARVRESVRLQLMRVLLSWADGELLQGRPCPVADRLAEAVDHHPYVEPLVLRLMRALYVGGRRAEALELYARTRANLADEFGVDPGAELQELHREILRGTLRGPLTAVSAGQPRAAAALPLVTVPSTAGIGETAHSLGCHLPADLPDHVGCDPEILCAMRVLQVESPRSGAAAGPVVVLSGPSGVGKTALSVRLAHLLRPSYPDAQIFVGLSGRRSDPDDALDQVLRALGATDLAGLSTLDQKVGRYRSLLSHRRVLIVLDSPFSADEVRPLMPGGPGSALIVSSRTLLTTLPGAEHIDVPLLDRANATALLASIVGPQRLRAEPEATDALVAMCAGLPLALRIVGARISARPHRLMARLVERMSDDHARLHELTADGLSVRASIAIGYRALNSAARRTFRLLGYLGVPAVTGEVAAALVDGSVDEADELLEQLADGRLVSAIHGPVFGVPSYRMHDLVRIFARERALAEESQESLAAAIARTQALGVVDDTA